MKYENLAAIVGAGMFALGCTNVKENELAVVKNQSGEISFYEGPKYEILTVTGTVTDAWDGRRFIELPLDKGTEETTLCPRVPTITKMTPAIRN